MANTFADYQANMLILLVGGNPLPNYVAAQLLAQPTARLLLVFSQGTRDQCDNLKKALEKKGYIVKYDDLIEVEESNPADIYRKVEKEVKGRMDSIGLNYTGGTKAMSVHAYRALEKTDGPAIRYYSYLDARTLSMWFTNVGGSTWPEPVGTQVQVSLDNLLLLHGLEKLQQEMSERVIWPETTNALAQRCCEPQHKELRDWYTAKEFNIEKGPNLNLSTDEFPQTIREALKRDNPSLTFPASFNDLVMAGWFQSEDRRTAAGVCGKWFTSTWLEEYIFRQVQAIQSAQQINDLKMSIKPALGDDDSFEFDVAFMRGYQLFGLSCSAMTRKKELKEKLLEAAVRAAQLGGGETCFALVCCAEGDTLQQLRSQLKSLPNLDERRIRVFGCGDLLNLQACLKDWIRQASATP
ncbi:MAG: hypothetical protein ACJ8CR_26360 [Roseiflexaceae bacterium]